MDASDRAEFFAGLEPGGKYDSIIGIYRHNISTDRIGVFDKELIVKLPNTVKWIAHNGAGYDQIDVVACKERGECFLPSPYAVPAVRIGVLGWSSTSPSPSLYTQLCVNYLYMRERVSHSRRDSLLGALLS